MLDKLPIRGPEHLDVSAKMVLRKAYAPDALPEEREAGKSLFERALDIVSTAACENREWIVKQLQQLGLGKTAAIILAALLGRVCR